MRTDKKLKGQVREAVISNMLIAGHGKCLAKTRPCHRTSLANNVNRHPHPPKFTDHADMPSCYNPTLTRISNDGFPPRYMDHAESLALGELGDPL